MDLNKIKQALQEFLDSKGHKLFEITYRKSDTVLEVLLDEELDMQGLEEISSEISTFLDRFEDEFAGTYYLDVSTVGVERPIRNEKEMEDAVGSYVYLKMKKEEWYGTLCAFQDGVIDLEVRDKNRTKHLSLNYEDVKKARYAVDFKGE